MAPADEEEAWVQVEVVFSPEAGKVLQAPLKLPHGSRVQEALDRSGLWPQSKDADERLAIGVWGKRCELGDVLRDGDRVEIYRPLQIDPKEARRLRHQRQRAAPKRR